MTTPAHEPPRGFPSGKPEEPLWDKARILNWLHEFKGENQFEAQWLASEIVDEYEAVLEFDRTRYAELKRQLAEARELLDRAYLEHQKGYLGTVEWKGRKVDLVQEVEGVEDD